MTQERNSEKIEIRIAPSLKKKLQEQANSEGLTVSAWIKARILANLKQRRG